MNRRKFLAYAALATGVIPLSGTAVAQQTSIKPLNIVTTTSMLGNSLAEIGGLHVSVKSLMGTGVDPHSYRHTRNAIVEMTRADWVVRHGLGLEAQMEDFFETLSKRQHITSAGNYAPKEKLLAYEPNSTAFDPHIWMDPKIWATLCDNLGNELLDRISDSAKENVNERKTNFLERLNTLDAYARDIFDTIPPEQRVLVTAHDAFRYFGQAYGFEVIGIQGISTASEAGLYRISQIVDLLVERKIKAAFIESSVSDRNIRALIEGAASQGHTVNLGGELFSDAMGYDNTYEGTMIGMLDHNYTTIARALGAKAPIAGMNNKLSGPA